MLQKTESLRLVEKIFSEVREQGPHRGYSCLKLKCSHISINQFLAHRYQQGALGGTLLSDAIWRAHRSDNKKSTFPVPPLWWPVLRQNGLEVSIIRSFIYWKLLSFLYFSFGVTKIFKSIFVNIFKTIKVPTSKFTMLIDLTNNNLPKNPKVRDDYTVINWFRKNRGSNTFAVLGKFSNQSDQFDENIIKWYDPLGPIGWFGLIKLIIFTFILIFFCVGNFLFGNGFKSIMVYELWLLSKSKRVPDENLASEYAFSNSSYIYRPLWSEHVESRGSDALLYFYSMNCMCYVLDRKTVQPYGGYRYLTWSKYLIWKTSFKDFLEPLTYRAGVFELVPSIHFSGNHMEIAVKENSIMVFDIPPPRVPLLLKLGSGNDYFSSETSYEFFKDLPEIAQKYNINFVIKQKRSQSYLRPVKYNNILLRLRESTRIEIVDADISAQELIEQALAVVSMPFTSTAHIACEQGKPSIYYDPTQRLKRNQEAALGVPLISSLDDFENWIKGVIKNDY